MDITDEAQVHAVAQRLKGVPIDVLINNAADTRIGETQRFGELDYERGRQVLETNILGPLLVSEAFLPQIEAGRQKKIISITSTHASLTQPLAGGGAIFYRASKAGLNRAMLAVSEDLKPKAVTVVLVHPGSLRMSKDEPATNMYGERTMVDIVAGTLMKTIERLSIDDSGHFMKYDGTQLAW
jgi:NAD(P)-dependent dehydrogenase (short-subunit alcohol dehydrogenase family)